MHNLPNPPQYYSKRQAQISEEGLELTYYFSIFVIVEEEIRF